MNMIEKNSLKISQSLFDFVNEEAIPGTELNSEHFWDKFSKIVHELTPINNNLIKKRETIQKQIDIWHKSHKGKELNKIEYVSFLKSIGYLVNEEEDFKIETTQVDEEISSIAGPQLVVPVDNARYAINAANARWGSLYNALYGTDVITGKINKDWDQNRAKKVISFVRNFLDECIPISELSWSEISKIEINDDKLVFFSAMKKFFLKNNNQFIGFNGNKQKPESKILCPFLSLSFFQSCCFLPFIFSFCFFLFFSSFFCNFLFYCF